MNINIYIIADASFLNAVQVVITWLERGDCNKRNVNIFYSIIQSTNSHVRRLLSEKTQFEEELQNLKDLTKRRMQTILLQCKYTLTIPILYKLPSIFWLKENF